MNSQNFLHNKKATSGDIYLSPWLFLNWTIVIVGIVIGVLIFYSARADVSNLEAKILNERIISCISTNFDYSKLTSPDFDIYDSCGFNKNLFEKKAFYYFNITLTDSLGKDYSIIGGNRLFEIDCGLMALDEAKGGDFAQCFSESMEISDNLKKYTLNVKTASNQP